MFFQIASSGSSLERYHQSGLVEGMSCWNCNTWIEVEEGAMATVKCIEDGCSKQAQHRSGGYCFKHYRENSTDIEQTPRKIDRPNKEQPAPVPTPTQAPTSDTQPHPPQPPLTGGLLSSSPVKGRLGGVAVGSSSHQHYFSDYLDEAFNATRLRWQMDLHKASTPYYYAQKFTAMCKAIDKLRYEFESP